MNFIHEDRDFDDLLRIVAQDRKLSPGLVEKDYWVTHALWALHDQGFDVWFKGGTSLSKGFGLIERFSEDLDLKIEPGRVADLLAVSNWKGEGTRATSERRAYFERLEKLIVIPQAAVSLEPLADRLCRSANLRVTYPGRHLRDLGEIMRPFVLLEVGNARVTPAVPRVLSSFVHAHLSNVGQLRDYKNNTPAAVQCVHPLVTLLEKLDAIHKRVPSEKAEPASFVRHFEDAARVIAGEANLPALSDYETLRALAEEMLTTKQIAALPRADDPAFTPDSGERWSAIRSGYDAIAPMFWGPRIPLDEACASIRGWLTTTFNL